MVIRTLKVLLLLVCGCNVSKQSMRNAETAGESSGEGARTESGKDVVHDPADFWLNLDSCSPRVPVVRQVDSNNKGQILDEHSCSYDAALNIRKHIYKRASDANVSMLQEGEYSETEYNEARRPVSYTSWSASDKKTKKRSIVMHYNAAGLLEKAVETRGGSVAGSRFLTTYLFGAGEDFVSERVEVFSANSLSSVVESDCYPAFMMAEIRPCEVRIDGEIRKKIEKQGSDIVEKHLVGGELTESIRFSGHTGWGYNGWNRISLKGSDNGESFQWFGELSCSASGDEQDCKMQVKDASGKEICSETHKMRKVRTWSNVVGSKRIPGSLELVVSLTFMEMRPDRIVSGTVTSKAMPGSLEYEDTVRIDVVPATNEIPDHECSYYADWNWPDPVWVQSFTSGSFSYQRKLRLNRMSDYEISKQNFAGITPEEIDDRAAIKSTVSEK